MTDFNVADVLEELLNDETLAADEETRKVIIETVKSLFSTY